MSLKFIANIAASAALCSALAACGVDDIQLNGKVFDALGVNTSSVDKGTPKIAARSGIVVPPNLSSLPEPGSGTAQQPVIGDVKDYDASRQTTQADLEKQQADYCKVHYEDAKIHGDQDAVLAEGPLGPCRASIMNMVKKVNGDDQ